MFNVRDFVDDGEFCGIPVAYDHSETTLTRLVFSTGGLRFEVTHLQYMDHLQIKAYSEGTNLELDVTITDVKWSSVHDLIDSFLRCRGNELSNTIHRVSTKEILYDVMVELSRFVHVPGVVFGNKGISGILSREYEEAFFLTVEDDEIILYTIDKTGGAFVFDNPKQAAKWIAERM